MNQEAMFKASFLQKQTEELEQNLELVDQEMQELEDFAEHLKHIKETKESSTISALGKGIYLKTSLESKELLVEVGAGVVVRKKIDETIEIIRLQIEKISDTKKQLMGKLDIYYKTLEDVMREMN